MNETKKTARGSLLVALGALVLVPACRDDRALGTERDPVVAPAPPVVVEGATPIDEILALDIAVDRMATAKCDFRQRCGEIGAGEDKDFASREACMAKFRTDLKEELNIVECRGGVVADELGECLSEVRNHNCNNPLDALGQLAACRTSDICKALAE